MELSEHGPELHALVCAAKTWGVLGWWRLLGGALDWVLRLCQACPCTQPRVPLSQGGCVMWCKVLGHRISVVKLPLAWLQTAGVFIRVSGWQESFWGCGGVDCVSHVVFTQMRFGEL